MVDNRRVAGVVLAGGRSRRMGMNKALLDFKGKKLIDHMCGILEETGVSRVIISGHVDGYECCLDTEVYAGPARAISTVLSSYSEYHGFLFLPVDMPLLTPQILHYLLKNKKGAFFKQWPLPAYIVHPFVPTGSCSVHDMLHDLSVPSVDLPDDFLFAMKNFNSPEEWKEALMS